MTLRRNIIISACFAALVPVIQAIPRQYNVVQRESLPIAREHNVAQRASVPVATTVPSSKLKANLLLTVLVNCGFLQI